MFAKIVGWVLGLSLLVILAAPFAHDAWNRYIYVKEIYQLNDPVALTRLNDKYGHVGGFASDAAERCQRIYGRNTPGCVKSAVANLNQ